MLNVNDSNININEKTEIETSDKTKLSKKPKKRMKISAREQIIANDSLIYFSAKLKILIKRFIRFQKIFFFILLIDFIILYFFQEFFYNKFYIISLLLMLCLGTYCFLSFRKDFDSVTKLLYKKIRILMYIQCTIVLLFFGNLAYLLIKIVFFEKTNKTNDIANNNSKYYLVSVIVFFLINFAFPVISVIKIKNILLCMKYIGTSKGENFEEESSGKSNIEMKVIRIV